MPYFRYGLLETAFSDQSDIRKLIINFDNLKKEIEKFYYVLMVDLCYLNLLYDENKGLFIIDTTSWWKNQNVKDGFFLSQNMHFLNKSLFICFCHYLFGDNYDLIIEDIEKKYQDIKGKFIGREFLSLLKENVEGKEYMFLELLLAYIELIKAYYGYEVETLGDIKKYTKIMKNS